MKRLTGILLILIIFSLDLYAQDVTTVTATSEEISDNLDLQAIASVFGESKDLEDFEYRINDPDSRISNLDLNGDGMVDYLRVIETSKEGTHLGTIQAVIGQDQFQDVCTIDVVRDTGGGSRVQVVGDVFMFGPDYIIQPVYAVSPVIFSFFWGPIYHPWYSPYYWGYYPRHYHPWNPYPSYRYHEHVHVHINSNNTYPIINSRNSRTAVELQKNTRRNDFGVKYPEKSFISRNQGISNRQVLDQNRGTRKVADPNTKEGQRSVIKTNPNDRGTHKTVTPGTNPAEKPTGRVKQENKTTQPGRSVDNGRPKEVPGSRPTGKPMTKKEQAKPIKTGPSSGTKKVATPGKAGEVKKEKAGRK